MDCTECTDPQDWDEYGCGWRGLEGKGRYEFTLVGGPEEPFRHSCPQYYRRLPWVQDLLGDLEDYRRGAMGNVMLLPAPWLQLLRAADAESTAWQNQQEQQLAERDR